MCIFAQYKDILGVPREGIHGIRVYDFAIVDFVMTFIGACIIAYFFKMNVLFVFIYLYWANISISSFALIPSFCQFFSI